MKESLLKAAFYLLLPIAVVMQDKLDDMADAQWDGLTITKASLAAVIAGLTSLKGYFSTTHAKVLNGGTSDGSK